MITQKFVSHKFNPCVVCSLLFHFCLYCQIVSFPGVHVVCCVEVAAVAVFVKCKRDDHVSNIYNFYQKYSYKEITDSQFLMVTQKIVTCKFNHCVICLLLQLFLFILLDSFFTWCSFLRRSCCCWSVFFIVRQFLYKSWFAVSKFVTCKWNRCVVCLLLFFLFLFIGLLDIFFTYCGLLRQSCRCWCFC